MAGNLQNTLWALLYADSPDEMRQLVEADPDLLGDDAIMVLSGMIGDLPERLRSRVSATRDALMEWRAGGLEAPVSGPVGPATGIPDELKPLIEASATATRLRDFVLEHPEALDAEREPLLYAVATTMSAYWTDRINGIMAFLAGCRSVEVDAATTTYDRHLAQINDASNLCMQFVFLPAGEDVAGFLAQHPILLGRQASESLTKLGEVLAATPEIRDDVRLDFKLALLQRFRELRPRVDEDVFPDARATTARIRAEVERRLAGGEPATTAAIDECDDLIMQFGAVDEPTPMFITIQALMLKSILFELAGRADDQLGTYNWLIRRFRDADDAPVRGTVASVFLNKADVLGRLGRTDEGLAAYHEVVTCFQHDSDPAVRDAVREALTLLGEAGA